jgi:lipopolysaccharide transport system permease protein
MPGPVSTPFSACKLLKKLVLFSFTVARRLPGTLFLRNLIERRSLLLQLVRRDFEQRFVGSAMGWIWGVINPLVLLVSWIFVFQYCMKVPPPAGARSYPLFVFAGMLPWFLFNETVQRSASSLLEQANLITKTIFPSEVVPVSVFLSTLVSHFLALALLVVAAGVALNQISIYLLLLPFYIFAIGLFAVGLGWVVASLNVFLRDTAQVVSVLLTFWFWLTPIFIAEDKFPPWARFVLLANPMSYVVRAYRAMLIGFGTPALADLAIVMAYGAGMFVVGGLFFRHMKSGFADVL